MSLPGRRTVRESAEEIAEILRDTAEPGESRRIEMLALFCEDAGRSFAHVALQLGVSERTVKRWWRHYSDGGISGLLGRTIDPGGSDDNFIDGTDGAGSEWTSDIMPGTIIEFLNALTPRGDEPLSPVPFRDALIKLLPDVDHVSVTVNRACDLAANGGYQPKVVVTQHVSLVPNPVMTHRDAASDDMAQHLLENYRSQGFPFEKYQPPHSYIYHLPDGAYLGAIFLWREREKKPVAADTLELVVRLQSFIVFLLTDLVARFRYSDPVGASYISAIEELAASIGLTPPEQQVVVMLAEGYTRKVMAGRLMISTHTVQAHMKSVFKKAGVHSATELMAHYLTPGRKRPTTAASRSAQSKK